MSRDNEHTILTVFGSRTIPTKPYGNEKWEFTLTREGTDLDEAENLSTMEGMIRVLLDEAESRALIHANLG